jgi:hypothetical protein
MLDDVAFGPITEQPAGKDSAPFILRIVQNQQLNKGTGLLRAFPLGSPLTRPQPHHGAPDADAFARFQRDFPYKPIALVE